MPERAETEALVPVEKLLPGLQVDLEGDDYNDPDDQLAEFEYAVVEHVEEETPDCTVVTFDRSTLGFPRGHLVRVRLEGGTQVPPTAEDIADAQVAGLDSRHMKHHPEQFS